MKILNAIILSVGLALTLYLISCGDDVITSIDTEQITSDSLIQSRTDSTLIDEYLESYNIHEDSLRVDSATGVRYAILKAGDGTTPNLNDIISIHYTGSFLSDTIFDTSIKSKALYNDSLAYANTYANNDSTFSDILMISDTLYQLTYEETIDSLNIVTNDINYSRFQRAREYIPITFNHTVNGSEIRGFILGFNIGLNTLMNLKSEQGTSLFEVGGKGVIFIPSAQAYGTTGNGTIPENTVLIFEFDFVNIKN